MSAQQAQIGLAPPAAGLVVVSSDAQIDLASPLLTLLRCPLMALLPHQGAPPGSPLMGGEKRATVGLFEAGCRVLGALFG